MNTQEYFKHIEEEVGKAIKVAERARAIGIDPVAKVEVPVAKTLAEKAIGLISTVYPQILNSGIVERILELEKEYGQLDTAVSFKIAEEIAREKFCKFESLLQAMDAGIRVGFSYNTLGVVSSPIEGFTELKTKKTRNGEDYIVAYFSGPIRSAGTTASCMALMLIDYLRETFGFAKYDPDENEVKRYVTENYDYHERVTNLQYLPTTDEIAFLAGNMPIEISGEPSEEREVSNYKDLSRVESNLIRGGMCLIFSEGLAQKAQKGFRLLKGVKERGFKTTGWDFLEEYVRRFKQAKKSTEGKDNIPVYIKDLVAGRPVYGHPSRSGGFRFRYGRTRTSGFSANAIHPATAGISDSFLSFGTQLKIEKPTKGCVVSFSDEIDGPIVKLKDGSVKKIINFEESKKIYSNVEEIIYLGDILVPFGDVLNRNYNLIKAGYVEEWWELELKKAGFEGKINKLEVSFEEAVKFSENFKIPMHPNYIYYWKEILKEQFFALLDWIAHGAVNENKLVLPFSKIDKERFAKGKRALELIGCEHLIVLDNAVLNESSTKALLSNLGIDEKNKMDCEVDLIVNKIRMNLANNAETNLINDQEKAVDNEMIKGNIVNGIKGVDDINGSRIVNEQEKVINDKEEKVVNNKSINEIKGGNVIEGIKVNTGVISRVEVTNKKDGDWKLNLMEEILSIINKISKFKIKDKSGAFIGTRMGRPEKSKLRKLIGSPHALFPVGEEGGRLRSVQAAVEKGFVNGEFANYFCEKCMRETIYSKCEKCGEFCIKLNYCPRCEKSYAGKCLEHENTEEFKERKIDVKSYYDDAKARTNLRDEDIGIVVKGVRGTSNKDHSCEHLGKGLLRAKYNLNVNKDGTIRYDMTEMPITHFKAKEIGTSVEKLKQIGYEKDIYGNNLENEEQVLEMFPHDVILPSCPESDDERADDVFFRICNFVDDELEKLYKVGRFSNVRKKEELVGQLIACIAPHICTTTVGRIIGFSKTQTMLASPYMHAAMRRDCDGDESAVMLLMDMLLNFSRKFLPAHRGGTQDAPLVLNICIRAGDVDDQILDFESSPYTLELYEFAEQGKHSSEVKSIETIKKRLKLGTNPFINIPFTHGCFDINNGVMNSAYKKIPTMQEKVEKQMNLCSKIRAVDADDVSRLVIERHFIRDIRGNLRKFSQQAFRCVGCNHSYRRPPLIGKCTHCGGRLIFTISEGGILKYMQPALDLAHKFKVSPYLLECLELVQMYIESIFGKEKEKQEALGKWF